MRNDPHLILSVVVGSRAYGLDTPDSDIDRVDIVVEPVGSVLGIEPATRTRADRDAKQGERSRPGDTETTIYPLRHFARLAAQGNPNLLDPLFAPDELVEYAGKHGRRLREARTAFLHVGTVHRLLGYARSQRENLLDHGTRRSHMPQRPELIERYGFDTKYAMHMARPGQMALRLTTEGPCAWLPLPKETTDLLQAIRAGHIGLDEVLQRHTTNIVRAEQYLRARTTPLPQRPDVATINAILIDAQGAAWGWTAP